MANASELARQQNLLLSQLAQQAGQDRAMRQQQADMDIWQQQLGGIDQGLGLAGFGGGLGQAGAGQCMTTGTAIYIDNGCREPEPTTAIGILQKWSTDWLKDIDIGE